MNAADILRLVPLPSLRASSTFFQLSRGRWSFASGFTHFRMSTYARPSVPRVSPTIFAVCAVIHLDIGVQSGHVLATSCSLLALFFSRRQDHLVTQVLSAGFLRYLGLSVKGFDSGLRPGIAGGRLWVPVLRAVACLPHSLGCPSLGSATAGIDSTAGPAFTAGMTSAAGVVFTAINLASGIGLAAGIASTATIVFTAGLALAAPGSTECVHPGWLIQFLHCIGPDRSPEL